MAARNEISDANKILGLTNGGRQKDVFIQTAIEHDQEKKDDVFSLPNIVKQYIPSFRKRRRGKQPLAKTKNKKGVLDGLTFRPPCASGARRASRYRLANLHSHDGASSNPVRHDVKRVERNRKSTERQSNRFLPDVKHRDRDHDEEWSDYDFDGEFEDDEEYKTAPIESPSQIVYKNFCKAMSILPSSRFYKTLVKNTDCVVKHQILTATGIKACARALLKNNLITKLHLEENEMGPEGALFIAALLRENMIITDLSIVDNRIGTSGLQVLAEVLKHHEKIRRLDLSGHGFDESDADYIAEIIECNTVLEELVLCRNCFRERGGFVIGKSLGLTSSLKVLNLSWNHLRRKGVIAISEAMAVNHSIESLDLSWNGFAMEGCKAMRDALKENTTLRELDISNSRVNFLCLAVLLKGLRENTSLEIFRLSENPITTEGASAIIQVLNETPSMPMKLLDIGGQCVDSKFLAKLEDLRENRVLTVYHGIVIHRELAEEQDQDKAFDKEDPMMVLMECMRLQNLRLVDLFCSLDKDGSKSLEHSEFKEGLLAINIPMTPAQIDKLIYQLDEDGDGEVDFRELVVGQRDYKRKLHKMKQRDKDIAYEDTEIGRISIKLRTLMAFQQRQRSSRLKKSPVSITPKPNKPVSSATVSPASSRPSSVPEAVDARGRRNTVYGLPSIQMNRNKENQDGAPPKLRRQSTMTSLLTRTNNNSAEAAV